jgi:hypothetical protein
VALAFAFPIQLVATVFAFLARDPVAGTGLGVFSGVWLTTGLSQLMSAPAATSDAVGFFYLLAGLALLLVLAAAALSAKVRELPLPTEVSDAVRGWDRRRPAELLEDPLLFPRLGRQRRDGSYPDAGGRLSDQGLSEVVKPIMLAAGVPDELAHPHVLRHTHGSLFMRRGGELSKLRELMGHASMDTTGVYVHHGRASLEAAVDVDVDEHGQGVLERHGERRRERAA